MMTRHVWGGQLDAARTKVPASTHCFSYFTRSIVTGGREGEVHRGCLPNPRDYDRHKLSYPAFGTCRLLQDGSEVRRGATHARRERGAYLSQLVQPSARALPLPSLSQRVPAEGHVGPRSPRNGQSRHAL